MQELASIFVSVVTLANTFVPSLNLANKLNVDSVTSTAQVLSVTDSKEDSFSVQRKNRLNQVESQRQENVNQVRTLQEEKRKENAEKREELKERLELVKNERKEEIVIKVSENIQMINEKWVNQWNKALTRLTLILEKAENNTLLSENRENNEEINNAISQAQSNIALAQESVNKQSSRVYVIQIDDEKTLGQNVRTTINQFHNDIKNTKDDVSLAKTSVVSVIRLLKNLKEVENEN